VIEPVIEPEKVTVPADEPSGEHEPEGTEE